MGCSPPGSSVPGILQARILDWTAISSSRGSSRLRDRTCVSLIAGRILATSASWKAPLPRYLYVIPLLSSRWRCREGQSRARPTGAGATSPVGGVARRGQVSDSRTQRQGRERPSPRPCRRPSRSSPRRAPWCPRSLHPASASSLRLNGPGKSGALAPHPTPRVG
mgnify:CR=1 FL=1